MAKPLNTASPTILIIDDSPESIDVLRGVLGGDYKLRIAIRGSIALDLAEKSPPDLILLDVMMPEMDGYEVCRRLKAIPATSKIPVIFITTLTDPNNEAMGLELGAVDYITKPYVPALVKSRVRSHLALHHRSLALEQLVTARTGELVETRLEIIRRLGRAAEYRDNETGTHVLRMSHHARLIALAYGLPPNEADLLLNAAPMHDIGKIGVPDAVLLKPGKLTPEEWEVMKRHTLIGAEIIGDHPSDLLRTARTVALHHHERWDGKGYPSGLKENDIPKMARLAALADVFDALVSVRPYKRAWSVDEAVAYIKAESGGHFEPAVVSAFLDVLPSCVEVLQAYQDG